MFYALLNCRYYNKWHGWVDHYKFATRLTYDEAMGLRKVYYDLKIQACDDKK